MYLNGRILPLAEATISPLDIGLLRGYAVFDLLRTVGGRPFLLAEHLRRLRASADHLGLAVPATDEQIAAAIDELLALNGHTEATVRLVLTGGVSSDGMAFDPTTPTFFILTHEMHQLPASAYVVGSSLLTHLHTREMPRAKTTNYLTMLRAKPRLAEAGALDLLYHDGEHVTEAASASVYFVHGTTILAPSAEDVLWGTVGSLVLDLAGGHYTIEQREVTLEEARTADEIFLTSTTRGVVPIVKLDDAPVGKGCPGRVTRALMTMWSEALAQA